MWSTYWTWKADSWLHVPSGAHAADSVPAEHPALACPWQGNRIWQDGSLAWLVCDALSPCSPSPLHVFPSVQEVSPIPLEPKVCCLPLDHAALDSQWYDLGSQGCRAVSLQHESESAELSVDSGSQTKAVHLKCCPPDCTHGLPDAVGGQPPAAGASRGANILGL